MQKFLAIATAAAAFAAVSTPALANETRVETHGGVYWMDGYTKATAGIAAGYDMDLGPAAFVGGEVSADKLLASNTKVAFGFTGRGGVKLGPLGKVYATGGYTTKPCDLCNAAWHLGTGYQQGFMGPLYGKVEYRHFFTRDGGPDSNALVAGVGLKF